MYSTLMSINKNLGGISHSLHIFFIKDFRLDIIIIMQLDILTILTPQVTIIICHHIKKVLLKKIQIMEG